ncbi:MAG: ribulose-phosphate 3-epimerase [Clostridia bacterium]|nr:ribulose-phosphate 3-epimerase [Clostridia bacterium]
MIKIAPSLLSVDFTRIGEEVKKIDTSADMLHLDVMDGHFVPNISFGIPVIKAVRKITDITIDTHLMISNPSKYLDEFAKIGCDLITVHAEAPDDILECLKHIKKLGKKAGIALNPDTPNSVLEKYIGYFDMVLQMTVFPGFGGQSIIMDAVDKIPQIRAMIGNEIDIEVDGGIYIGNVCEIVKNGANVIVSGSGIFGQADAKQAVIDIRKACEICEVKNFG